MPDRTICHRCGAPIAWVAGYRWPVSTEKGYFVADASGLEFGIVARTGQKLRGRFVPVGAQGSYVCHREHVCQEKPAAPAGGE